VFHTRPVGDTVVKVAGTEITVQEVNREFDNRLRGLQQQLGTGFDRHQAIGLGLMQQAVQTTVARRLVEMYARDLGITVSDQTLAEAVRQNPAFQSDGQFDRQRLELVVRSSGMSEAGFLEVLRGDMLRNQVIEAMIDPLAAPLVLTSQLNRYDGEQRSGTALVVPASAMQVDDPDDATLQTYLEAHSQQYQAPEYRSAVIVLLRPEDLAPEIVIADDAVRAEYDSRIDEFRTPETREVEQLLAADQATIEKAAALVDAGKTLQQVAAELAGDKIQLAPLGAVAKGQLPEPLDGAIFDLGATGDVSKPVQSGFGWHLFKLQKITPEHTIPFEEKKDALRHELQLRAAVDQLPALGDSLEDAVAGGAPLEEAAKSLGLKPLTVPATDKTGKDKAGKSVLENGLAQPMIDALFLANEGQVSPLDDGPDGGFFVFRLDKIEPGRTRELAEVRDEVLAAWRQEQQTAKAKEEAEKLLARAVGGETLEAIHADNPTTQLRPIQPLKRADQGFAQLLSPDAVKALFEAEPDSIVRAAQALPDGSGILRLGAVIPAEPLAGKDLDTARQQLAQAMQSDLLREYEAALRNRYPVDYNQQTLASLLQPPSDQ
jgi:peptidyl-prolyl cis-trans isomerase D